MKTTILYLIVFLCFNFSYAQEESQNRISQKDSLRLANYKVISLTTGDDQNQLSSPSQNVLSAEGKVRATSQDADYIHNNQLDELISSYWSVQEGIRDAKNNSDFQQIDQYETNSSNIKAQYIEIYQNISQNNLNPEYTKLYNQFKKDF